MNYFFLFLQFILSGSIVVGATLLAKHVDEKWAGLLVALPLLTLLGFIFMTGDVDKSKYLLSAILFMIPAALYLISLLLLHSRMHIAYALAVSLIPLAIAIYVIQRINLSS
jgi:uncharacterized membrane protein (GlpM family)